MSIFLRAFAACALSAGLTALLVRYSYRLKLMASPRADRWHKVPTPNTGGLAIMVACALVYALATPGKYGMVAACAAGVALLGVIDDRVQLRPLAKLAGQAAAATAVLASGVVFRATPWEPLNLAISFLWIVGITNAFNLIDNMDGLCAGVAIIISLFRCWFALANNDPAGAALTAILAGGYLGFLFFNYKPARIFMGDGGSMFAGFSLAALTIASPIPLTKVFLSGLFYPALTFLYPIFDVVLVSFLRRAAGKPISVGGRDHSSHRLVSLGHSEQKVVWLLWILTAIGSLAGLTTSSMPLAVNVIGALLVFGIAVFGVFLGTLPAYEMPDSAPVRATWLRRRIPTLRAGTILLVETALAGVALLAAFLLRWDSDFLGIPEHQFFASLPVFLVCQAIASLSFRTFNLGWRYFDTKDLFTLGQCTVLGSALSTFVLWMSGIRYYSRGVIVLYGILFLFCTVGLRAFMPILWQTLAPVPGRRRAAILGSGPSGELLAMVLRRNGIMDTLPVLILDTDPARRNTRVQGVPVRYADADVTGLLRHFRIEILILPRAPLHDSHRGIIDVCASEGIPVSCLELSITPLYPEVELSQPSSASALFHALNFTPAPASQPPTAAQS